MFYDTHAHLNYPEFANDVRGVMDRAQAAGVGRVIAIGTDLESSAAVVRLAGEHPAVFAAVGWHPGEAMTAPEDIRPALLEMARHPKVVAIGETGLDYYRLPTTRGGSVSDDEQVKRVQARLFRQHIEVAVEAGLNCVIHTRDCFDAALEVLTPFSNAVRGVFHCFVGTVAEMERVIAIGSLVSFTGILTFKNAVAVRETLAATPMDRFMLETDCPYLAPVPHRGRSCEPAFLKETAIVAAQVKRCSMDELAAVTCETAARFFPRLA